MRWGDEPHRYALLELWAKGALRKRQRNSEAWDELERLPWTRRTGRSGELRLVPERRPDLEQLLDGCWPKWRQAVADLRAADHPADEAGWRALQDQQRREGFPGAPGPQLNRRTAAGVLAEHSKAGLRATHRSTLEGTTLTGDNLLRLRPCDGLLLRRGDVHHDAVALAKLLGEVVLTERAMLEGTRLAGRTPAAVLVVENLGPYVDLPAPEGWLVAHGPGWNLAAVKMLLDQLSPDVPVIHFGDLDENG
ncbi:MAG TPA: Wadjet anti-phage system protein JetD domain-containing protein, partial [Myxococcales bacterium]|nr:Wadjet anti-phage system protein JetD domain-containing protein [Myxococcales bacterium]